MDPIPFIDGDDDDGNTDDDTEAGSTELATAYVSSASEEAPVSKQAGKPAGVSAAATELAVSACMRGKGGW